MKLIGITGSCGKTSVAEIVYQYLLYKGYNISLYCSNGLFVNGLTRGKDFLQTTLSRKDLDLYLREDEENNVQFAIIEITAESIKRGDIVHKLPYEVVALTSFYSNLHNHFDNKENYLSCKREILSSDTIKKVLLRIDDDNYSMFQDIDHISYGYSDNAFHKLTVIDNKIEGLTLSYHGLEFKTNLITGYHARNIACALAIITELNVLDINDFSTFAKQIFIRGRFEKILTGDRNIIIDTGFAGSAMLLSSLEYTLGHNNYKIIFSNIPYTFVNEWVKNARQRTGKYLKRGKFIYLTNPSKLIDEEEVFLNEVICDRNYKQYKYIPNIDEACKTAYNELNPGETLVIISRENYRMYRQIFNKLINKG